MTDNYSMNQVKFLRY